MSAPTPAGVRDAPLEDVTDGAIEAWLAGSSGRSATRNKALVLLHGIFRRARKVYGLPLNPAAEVESTAVRRSGDIEVFSPEEVWALVRAAASEQDAAIYPDGGVHRPAPGRAARAALARRRLRRVDDPRPRRATPAGELTTPKSGKVRVGADGPRRRRGAGAAGQRGSTSSATTTSSSSGTPAATSTARALRRRYKRGARTRAGLRRCASTTCGTPSARG